MKRISLIISMLIAVTFFTYGQSRITTLSMPDISTNFGVFLSAGEWVYLEDSLILYVLTADYRGSEDMSDVLSDGNYNILTKQSNQYLLTTSSVEFASVGTATSTITSTVNYAADTSSTDAYKIAIDGITAYTPGLWVTFLSANANTGAAALQVNGLSSVAIKKLRDQDLITGDIEADQIVMCVYDGTYWQMISHTAQ